MNQNQTDETSSFVRVGQIVAPHGIRGGVRVFPLTDFHERFEKGSFLFIRGERYKVTDCAWHKGQARLQLNRVSTVEEAEKLKWEYLEVKAGSRPNLGTDEYLTQDLIGLHAVTPEGEELGPVEDVIASPANDLLVVAGAMIPAVKQFVKRVDLEKGEIVIQPIPGLFGELEEE